ncbi:hypothetical protein [Sediminivirga luteola]|uniref:Uncharacterized protein n=1 Tax=Sediminivirga luteola TaxID=1774748 RepID=A0A8J2TWT5_9MICO|nr:hypothetical protein [Sediminivirga luteola]MCI2265485.1 hypothetical protein [Sediminivirga luteola]GGA10254.1 hypothetical protein GCM10011333_11220 [Sediminivirga luteola]
MNNDGRLAMTLSVLFAVSLATFVLTGTISGYERDENIYGSAVQTIFPVAGLAALVSGVAAVTFGIRALWSPQDR